jgi:hypothetical protein
LGRTLTTTGHAGYLLFGPYAPLATGTYRARLHLAAGSKDCTGSYADVVMNKGQQVLGTAAVNGRGQGEELLEILFSVVAPCTDFEVRLWVTDQTDLAVSRVEIEPSHVMETLENPAKSSSPDDLSIADAVNPFQSKPIEKSHTEVPVIATKNARQAKTVGRAKKGKHTKNLSRR